MAPELEQLQRLSPEALTSQLLGAPEDQWFDRKSGRVAPRDLAKTIIAMANADGGLIAIGFHGGSPDPLAHHPNDWRQASFDFARPVVRIEVVETQGAYDHAAHPLVLVRVDRADQVIATPSDEVYLRVGDEDRRLTFEQRRELMFDKGQTRFEETVIDGLTRNDLDSTALSHYAEALGGREGLPAATARGLVTAKGDITVAGVVGFATEPDRWLPQHVVRVIRYNGQHRLVGTRQNIVSDERYSCPLERLIPEVAARVESSLPNRRALTRDGTFETVGLIPEPVWLEAVVNAIIHRSYSNSGDHIRIEVFEDSIVVESPGRFPGVVDLSNLRTMGRYARNPRLARLASDLRFGQELGEGIRRMFQDMSLAGLVEPAFHQTSGSVQVVLSGIPIDAHLESRLPRRARDLLVIVREQDHPSTRDVMDASGLSRPVVSRTLQALESEGLVERVGSSPQDPRAYWQVRQAH